MKAILLVCLGMPILALGAVVGFVYVLFRAGLTRMVEELEDYL